MCVPMLHILLCVGCAWIHIMHRNLCLLAVCVNVNMSFTSKLTLKDSACPYLALIFGSQMVARLVPLTVS